jgi:xylulokinase
LNTKVESQYTDSPWVAFSDALSDIPPLCQHENHDPTKIGLCFPRPEIVPSLPSGQWQFLCRIGSHEVVESEEGLLRPEDDARAIAESQVLSLRLRSKDLVSSPGFGLPPQPRRMYLVGGSSWNSAIAKVVGELLGGSEGVYKLDVGENACAPGAAYTALWSLERRARETFEELIGRRWEESQFEERVAKGYQEGIFEEHGEALHGFSMMENILLERQNRL